MHYVLDENGEATPFSGSVVEWAKAFELQDRKVAKDWVGDAKVSTVFLGLATPMLFETLVLGGPLDGECERYWTRAEALKGHAAMLKQVKGVCGS